MVNIGDVDSVAHRTVRAYGKRGPFASANPAAVLRIPPPQAELQPQRYLRSPRVQCVRITSPESWWTQTRRLQRGVGAADTVLDHTAKVIEVVDFEARIAESEGARANPMGSGAVSEVIDIAPENVQDDSGSRSQ